MDREQKAVVDRFEAGKAVLLVGEREEQLVVDRGQLPAGTREGDWLRVEVTDDVLIRAEADRAETKAASERIAAKLERLRRGKAQ
jgi:hypothetical protein